MEVDPIDPTVFILKNRDSSVSFDAGTAATGLDTGTNRLRLTYDWFQKTAVFAIDVNYAGGAFTADVTIPAVNTLDLYGGGGWPAAPARVYFGGDDGTVFKDFKATLTSPSTMLGDFNSSGTITSADWVILRDNLHSDFSAMTFSQAYHLGDVTANRITSFEDFALFKDLYDEANGAGSFVAMLAALPEPSTSAVVLSAAALALPLVRRARRRS
jgi:hypothetical protein